VCNSFCEKHAKNEKLPSLMQTKKSNLFFKVSY